MRKLHKYWASSSTESMAARPQQQGSGDLCSFALRNQKHSEHFIAKQFEKGGKTPSWCFSCRGCSWLCLTKRAQRRG